MRLRDSTIANGEAQQQHRTKLRAHITGDVTGTLYAAMRRDTHLDFPI